MWEPAISGMGNTHNCAPKLQASPPIFSLTPNASGSTRLQSCEDHEDRQKAIKAGMKAKEVDCDATIDRILKLDVEVRGLKTATETATAQKNKLAKENATLLNAFKDDVRNRVFKPNPNNNQDDNASEPMTWADAFQKMLNNRKDK